MECSILARITDAIQYCQVCFERYTEPRVLSCLHVFCYKCLDSAAREEATISCSICKTVTMLDPRNKLAGLPDASFLLILRDEDSKRLEDMVMSKKCGVCEDGDDEATAECLDCRDYLCQDCVKGHKRTKFTRGHRVVSLSENTEKNEMPSEHGNEFDEKSNEITSQPGNVFDERTKDVISQHGNEFDEKSSEILSQPGNKFDVNHFQENGSRSILSILDEDYNNGNLLSTIDEQENSDKSSQYSEEKSVDAQDTKDELTEDTQFDTKVERSNEVRVQDEETVAETCSDVSLDIEGAVDQLHRKMRELTLLMEIWNKLEEGKVEERKEVETDVDDFSQRLAVILEKQRSWLHTEADIVYSRVFSEVASARERLEKRLSALHYVTQFITALKKYGNAENVLSLKEVLTSKIAELLSAKDEEIVLNGKFVFEPDNELLSRVSQGIGKLNHIGIDSGSNLERPRHGSEVSLESEASSLGSRFHGNANEDGQAENGLDGEKTVDDTTNRKSENLLWVVGSDEDNEISLKNPCGLLVTKISDVIVADQGNHRLMVFDKNGKFKTKVELDMAPNDVVLNNAGQVAATGTKGEGKKREGEVQVWRLHRKKPHEFLVKFGGGILKNPHGIAVDSQARYVIADVAKHRVTIHQSDGGTLMSFGEHGAANDQFYLPYYVTVNSSDDIIVSDEFQKCLKVFNSRGRFLRKVGPKLNRDFHLRCPGGVCVIDDVILVIDIFTGDVMSISKEGRFQRVVLSQKDGLSYPQTLAVGPEGILVVTEGSFFKGTHCVKAYRLEE